MQIDYDLEIGEELVQPYEIIKWKLNKYTNKFEKKIIKLKAIYKLIEVKENADRT